MDTAGGGFDQAVEQPHHGRLARPGQAHDDEDLATLDGKACIEHADDVAGLAEDFVLVGALAEHLHGHVRVGTEHLEDVVYRKNLIGMAHTTLFVFVMTNK
ncbi:hypothetical protein D3C71_1617790 [compost metagenome]